MSTRGKATLSTTIRIHTSFAAAAAAMAILVSGCGGGGNGDGGGGPAAVQVTGKLSAPGGTLAFNAPTGLKRFFAEILGRPASAALAGMSPVAGATVKLIEINSAGTQVGADITTASSAADGSFTLNAPAPFVPGPRYVVRASGAVVLDRLVTGLTSQDVDPGTHAAKSLVLAQVQVAGGSAFQNLQPLQVEEIATSVADLIHDINPVGLTSIPLANALQAAAQADPDYTSPIANLTAADRIEGTVTDSSDVPLAGIRIEVRDWDSFNVRASSLTDSSGHYGINLAQGDYVVGAMNFTATSMAASEWWTCNDVPNGPACGEKNILFRAGRVTVGAGVTPVNFKLEAGARIQGTITSAANPGTSLPRVDIAWREFPILQGGMFRNSRADGSFRVNVRPGSYAVVARNRTPSQPYASGWYNGPAAGGAAAGGGGATMNDATPVTVAAGATYTLDFPLIEGGLLHGLLTDGATPTPNPLEGRVGVTLTAPGTSGGFVNVVTANSAGNYRMWVRPGSYSLRMRAQLSQPTVVAYSSNNNPPAVNFGAQVGRATAVVRRPDNSPASLVTVAVYDNTGAANFQQNEFTRPDGTVEVYAQPTGNYRIEYRLEDGSTTTGSAIHDGTANPTQTQLLLGALTLFDTASPTPTALGTVTLPAGGLLKGVITLGGVPAKSVNVQVRSGGTSGTNRFVTVNTRIDGSYAVSLPAGTYGRVCAWVPGTPSCPTPALANSCNASADNVTVTANQTTVQDIAIPPSTMFILDHNGVGLSGVNAYLDGSAIPFGTSDATGNLPFGLAGIHTVHFYKANYYVTSHVNRDWTGISTTQTVTATRFPDPATTGTVSGTISTTVAGDPIRVVSRRSSDGFGLFTSLPTATGTSTPYSLNALTGASDLFVVPNSIGFAAGSSFAGYNTGFSVPTTVNPNLMRGTATPFTVTGTGGFAGAGTIHAVYLALADYRHPGSALLSIFSASTSGTTLGATAVNVPPLNAVYPSAGYQLRVSAFSGPTGAGNYQIRQETRAFPDHAGLAAAPAAQDIVLTDDALIAAGPAHNSINVPVAPTFTWSRTGTPEAVEIILFEYDAARLDYVKFIWYARVFGNTFSVTPPAWVTLSPNTAYAYQLYARRTLTNLGVFAGYQRNGWERVKFSTGATPPP